MKKTFAALAMAGAVAMAGPAVATAESPATAQRAATSGEIGPLDANGCNFRNGPGHIDQNCIDVRGYSTWVDTIRGEMISANVPPTPITLCNVKVEVWATYANGNPYRKSGYAACSWVGQAFVKWNVKLRFKHNTQVCSRTLYAGEWSNPACITIKQ